MKMYKVFPEEKLWSDASEECKKNNAKLVEITNLRQNNFIHNMLLPGKSAFIGLHRTDFANTGKPFVWNENEDVYKKWTETSVTVPNPIPVGEAYCAALKKDQSWELVECELAKHASICSHEIH
ncbi:lymphocyte antigen 75-like [Tubulanus polymorphus]|uniref:lymphocyte antigen 75-like n=1 Tax=Tubulanus polymorphus TaxID=672921 RepID=UPI003DA376FA